MHVQIHTGTVARANTPEEVRVQIHTYAQKSPTHQEVPHTSKPPIRRNRTCPHTDKPTKVNPYTRAHIHATEIRETDRETKKQNESETDKQKERQKNRETDRQRNRE